jgi:hypothetical protein
VTRNELLDELVKIEIEEKSVKRNLDINYLNQSTRTKMFYRLKELKKMKKKVKFMLSMERKMKNEK